jgi:hypothetical protein
MSTTGVFIAGEVGRGELVRLVSQIEETVVQNVKKTPF